MSSPVDRRKHNSEMWERAGLPPIVLPCATGRACHNLRSKLEQAAREYVEEQGVGG